MKKRSLERGNSLVEVALVLPVVLILFLGVVEVAFVLLAHVQVANATREGARYASLCRLNDNCASLSGVVKSTVFAEAQYLNMTDAGSGGNTSVVVIPASLASPPAVGAPVTVTVTYQHVSPFVSNFVPMFPAQIPVRHTLIMHFDK
jgi:Flp pilus assembly protein TadG